MKKRWFKSLLLCLIVGVWLAGVPGALAKPDSASSGAPTLVSYQGQVSVSGGAYSGTGYFKFAVVNAAGTSSYWSNDGTSSAGSEPSASVALSVSNGLFHVLLGDTSLTGMSSALTAAAFATNTHTYLRVWFSENGSTFTLLTPDQRIAAVPYALQAESAKDADTLDGQDSTAFQLQVTGSCQPGSTIQTVNADGSVLCESHDAYPLYDAVDHGVVGVGHDAAVGPDGLPLILSYSGDQILAVHCDDQICRQRTLNSTTPVPGASWSGGIAMAFNVEGLAVFTIWDSASGNAFFGHCNDPLCSSIAMIPISPHIFPVSQVNMDMTITIDGLAMLAGIDIATNTLHLSHCLDPICGATLPTVNISNAAGTPSITMMGDGFPLVVYRDSSSGSLTTTTCTDAFCTTPVMTVVHATAPNAAMPVVATGVDGFGSIAYINTSVPSVRYAKCADGGCTSVTTNHVWGVTLPFILSRPSIITGADGLPLIGLYDDTTLPGPPAVNPGFYVAHCADLVCSNTTTNQLQPVSGDGWRSALTIGTDGLPFVTFNISASSTVMAMHCSNSFCIPHWRGW
jgi:hypothetical protein